MRILFATIFILSSFPACAQKYADPFTAQDLFVLCRGSDTQRLECASFVKGVRSGAHAQRLFIGFTFVENKTEPPNILKPLLLREPFCLPQHFSDENVVNSVVDFIENMPKPKRKSAAGFAVVLALNNQYPCR